MSLYERLMERKRIKKLVDLVRAAIYWAPGVSGGGKP